MKKSVDDLGLFGGIPLFSTPRPIGQLAVPDIDRFLTFANGTAIPDAIRELECRLAAYHGVDHCIAMANAGFAIMLLMRHFAAGRAGNVIMPSFTFRGLPHFGVWAGQTPRFCDVDRTSHGLDPARVAAAIDAHTTSILAVCNAHHPGDIDGLCTVARDAGIPIFFDSVYALGCTHRGRLLGAFGQAEVYSLHATKLLNGFEGGYVTTSDAALARALRHAAGPAGLDVGLDPLHAAMALASLDDLDQVIARNEERYRTYRRLTADLAGFDVVERHGEPRERYNHLLVVGRIGADWPLDRDRTVALLRAEGANIHPYYSPPLHRSVHCPPGCGDVELPVTDHLASCLLQLPSGDLVSDGDVEDLAALLHLIAAHGDEIAARLDEAGR